MRITRSGLATIAILTYILWGCIFMEQRILVRARADAHGALNEIRALQLKKHILPASSPVRPLRSVKPEIG